MGGAHKLMELLGTDHNKRCCLIGHRDLLSRFTTGACLSGSLLMRRGVSPFLI